MKELLKSIFEITVTKVIVTFISALLLASSSYFLDTDDANLELDDEDQQELVAEKHKENTLASKRSPSSIPQEKMHSIKVNPRTQSPEVLNRNEDNYNSISNTADYMSPENQNKTLSNYNSSGPIYQNRPQQEASGPIETVKAQEESSGKKNGDSQTFLGAPSKVTESMTSDNKTGLKDNNEMASSSPEDVKCLTDVISGTLGNPISVNINCNYPASIKYCLSKDTCCDPKHSGTHYVSAITIGAISGSYCLSYYGESDIVGVSEIMQNNYTINNSYPHLVTGGHRSYYQTTELAGETFLTSNDFGKPEHYAGQINFKSNDPTALGLNYSCEEIAESDHLTLSPLPSSTLNLFNISALLPSHEIKIPFREDKLDYGINYLSSYLKNNSYVVPIYSCSTTKVTLEDFNYFETSMTQASAGDNNVREFEGQFTSFGFFEEDTVVFRGPAGESTNEKSGTSLESGFLSIFY